MLSGCKAKPKTSFQVGTVARKQQLRTLVNLSFALALLSLAACRGADRNPMGGGGASETEIWVAVVGSDDASGEYGEPVRTLKHALDSDADVIRVDKGRHVIGGLYVLRTVRIVGSETGRTVLGGKIFVDANQVEFDRLDVQGGLSARRVTDLRLIDVRLAAGPAPAALSVSEVQMELLSSEVSGGNQNTIEAVSSTISIERTRIDANGSKRGIHQRGGVLVINQVQISGGDSAAMLVADKARCTGRTVSVLGEGGSITAKRGATLDFDGLTTEASRSTGVLVQGAHLKLKHSHLASVETSLGVVGGTAMVRGSTLSAIKVATVSVAGPTSRLELSDSRVDHRTHDGLLVESGRVEGSSLRFVGAQERDLSGHAIVARGNKSFIKLEQTDIQTPAGYGLLVADDVQTDLQVSIDKPRLGGIHAENLWAWPLNVRNSQIQGCLGGDGISVHNASATLSDITVNACGDAGLLLGHGSEATATKVSVTSSKRWAFAAFGRSSLELTEVKAVKTPFATFASCATAARISFDGKSQLSGRVVECP